MRGLRKKRVSWASDICQVKLFLLEESPSSVKLGTQDHLQAKASYSTGAGSDDNMPPGFEGTHPANVLQNKLSQIPVIQWQCPPRFVIDPTWQVVAGEESTEVERETQREMGVFEAVYPRPSAIPPNPSLLLGADGYDTDHQTPLIPITPIEDDDAAAADTSFDNVPPNTLPMSSQAQAQPSTSGFPVSWSSPASNGNSTANLIPPALTTSLGVEPDIVKAAYTALTAVMASNDPGNLVDPDLLVKILSDPMLVEKLGSSHRANTTKPEIMPNPNLQVPTLPDMRQVHINRTEGVSSSLAATTSRPPFFPPMGRVGPIPNFHPPPPEVVIAPPRPQGPPPVTKDINYYKSLIQQHGGERQEPLSQFDNRHHQLSPIQKPVVESFNTNLRELKPKIMKPCIYFNSSRGCRHGANCAFQHDVSSSSQQRVNSMPELPSAKRMRMDREITGV